MEVKHPREKERKQHSLAGLEATGHTGHGDQLTAAHLLQKSVDPMCAEIKVGQKRSSSAYDL